MHGRYEYEGSLSGVLLSWTGKSCTATDAIPHCEKSASGLSVGGMSTSSGSLKRDRLTDWFLALIAPIFSFPAVSHGRPAASVRQTRKYKRSSGQKSWMAGRPAAYIRVGLLPAEVDTGSPNGLL